MLENIERSFPKVLYKYRDWSNPFHQKIIVNREVYFASPKTFEDFLDCNLQPDYSPLTKKVVRQIFEKKFDERNPGGSVTQKKEFVNYWMQHSPLVSKYRREKIRLGYRKEFHQMSGVFSVTSSADNKDLWKKYAANENGFCIGFDSSFFLKSDFPCSAGRVEYYKHLPKICPVTFPHEDGDYTKKWITEIHSKKEKWGFEKEFRLHSFQFKSIDDINRQVVLPPEAFTEVHLGSKMIDSVKTQVVEALSLCLPNVTIIDRSKLGLKEEK